ncbi:MAG TPA: hypothetical protein VK470_19670, partial [Bacteroidota bacterium]|nr:hypothetical protein [Bacteroidota bacterium]
MTKPSLFQLCICMLAVNAMLSAHVAAQSDAPQSSVKPSNFWSEALKFSGELSAYGELNGITGAPRRRDPSTGRIFFRPTLTIFDAMNVSADLLLSTEGNAARQDINQLGLHPTWRWGRAHIGDYSDEISPYTLSGIPLRGGGVIINPGLFRFSALGGQARRAVSGGAETGSYKRYLVGASIGVGDDDASFIDLQVLRVRDDPASLADPNPAVSAVDSANTILSNPYATTPQENLVAGIRSRTVLFNRSFTWNLEANGSIYTRDMRLQEDTTNSVPQFVHSIFRPRLSSNADFMAATDVNMNLSPVNLRTGYKYIGPGYTSLGVGWMTNDQQEIMIAPMVRIPGGSLMLSWTRQNDNLLGQKLNTTVRQTMTGMLNMRPRAEWSSTVRVVYMTMDNHAPGDSARFGFQSLMLGTNQQYAFGRGCFLRSVNLDYSYSGSIYDLSARPGSQSTTHSAGVGGVIPVGDDLLLLPAANVSASVDRGTTNWSTVLTAQHRSLSGRLSTTGSCMWSFDN